MSDVLGSVYMGIGTGQTVDLPMKYKALLRRSLENA